MIKSERFRFDSDFSMCSFEFGGFKEIVMLGVGICGKGDVGVKFVKGMIYVVKKVEVDFVVVKYDLRWFLNF